jgi:replicative DNA helicase
MSDLNTPPFNLQAEESVIGSVLIDPEMFFEVAKYLTSKDFHIVKHQWIWKAFEDLHDKSIPFDILTVQQDLEKKGLLNELGGAAYLTRLITLTPTAYNAPAYARFVDEAATRRRMIFAASDIAKLAYEADTDIETCITNAMSALSTIVTVRGGAQSLEKHMSKAYDEILYRYDHPEEVAGLQSGFIDFDKGLGGFQRGLVYLISGDAGIGKTVFAIQAALNLSKQKPGAIYEMEMKDVDVCQRMIAAEHGLDTRVMKSGQLNDDQWKTFTQAVNKLSQRRIFMSDVSSTNTMGLRADLMRLKTEGVEWAVVDYLNLLSDRYGKDNNERQEYISRQLKSIAKDLNIALIVIQSVNKTGQMSGPNTLKHDCDVLIEFSEHLVDEGDTPKENVRTLKFGKNRFGTSMRIELMMLDGPRLVCLS